MRITNFNRYYKRLHEIEYMFICEGYTVMVLRNGDQEVLDIPLFEIEKELCEERFFRVHRSYLVNLSQVKGIGFTEKGMNVRVNGHELPVSRRRKRALLRVLGNRKKTYPSFTAPQA